MRVTPVRKRVIELVRVSTESQAGKDRAGIPAQKEANRQTAIRYDLEIVSTIEISDVSGAAVLRSPEMQKLLKLIESSEVHGVVAKEFSRLMRPENFADFALLQSFADTDTVLYLPEGPIDFSSKSGRLFGTLRAAMAGAEKVEIAERVWGAKEEKRRAGKHPQSEVALPFGVGFERGKDRWFFKPEAEKVLVAFRFSFQARRVTPKLAGKLGSPRLICEIYCETQFIRAGAFIQNGATPLQKLCVYALMGGRATVPKSNVATPK